MRNAISAGDILRTGWPADLSGHVNLYAGSGRMGACFDAWGLMHNGIGGRKRTSVSNTTIMHADHWHRGDYGMDYWLPVARLVWAEGEPAAPDEWRQEQALYEGRMTTAMRLGGSRVEICSRFSPERPDVLAIEVSHDGPMPALLVAPETEVDTHYKQHVSGEAVTVELGREAGSWLCRLSVGTAESLLAVEVMSEEGAAALEPAAGGMKVAFAGSRGRHLLLIGVGAASRRAELAAEMNPAGGIRGWGEDCSSAWRRRWGDGFIHVPHPQYQAMWARSLHYVLASYGPDVRSPAPPMGWSANGWPFHFPQDVSYIHPALLRLGHVDIARSWVEFYRERLENMREFTRYVYGAGGVMWAWEFPIGPASRMLESASPNVYQYEIHNGAYPVRMAVEAAIHLGDDAWTREVAWPVVVESARFYGSVLDRESDGTWGIHVVPSMGQDEAGGPDAKNYLCALFSARYALTKALGMGRDLGVDDPDFAKWRRVLADGLAVGRLFARGKDLCATCEGELGRSQIGLQKHPVQLNPLTFLPMGKPDYHVERAYERRYDLCGGVKEGRYAGWTLAAYWLAASHMEDASGLMHELAQAIPGDYVDPGWIQIYETSGAHGAPFYLTSHGLYLQALNDAVVSDYWGEVRIGAAVPDEWREVRFGALRTADGHVLSGRREGGKWRVGMEVAE